jgi:tRNA-dihydrouridine synthase B
MIPVWKDNCIFARLNFTIYTGLFQIMSVQLSLAPFLGLTSRNYRNAFATHFLGLDRVFAPFISGVHPEKANLSKFSDVLPIGINPIETIPQFVSTNPQEIITMCRVFADEGYTHINWNMGCPFSKLADKKRGCGILPYPDEIQRMLDTIMPVIPIQLSIKTRLGYYNTDELPVVIGILNNYPLKELIIHARTGKQLYTGETYPGEFMTCMLQSKMPVVYNGDIFHATRFRELKERLPGVSGWMIGRGALINPFLASQIKNITMSENEKRATIHSFHSVLFKDLSSTVKHEKRMLGQMKAVWYYMSGLFSGGKHHFKALKVCQDSQSYLKFAHELLEQPFATDDEIERYWKCELKHVG